MSSDQGLRLIAILDDDKSVQTALQDLIESEGLSTLCFCSAEEFLNSRTQDEAGCLIADIRMPGMSGIELQSKLKADRCRIPIIFITAHGDADMRLQAMRDGAVEFLAKPFDNEVLLESVYAAVEDYAKTLEAPPADLSGAKQTPGSESERRDLMPSTQNQWLDQVQSVLEVLNQGVIISNGLRQIVFANTKFLEMIKMPESEVCGRLVTDLYPREERSRIEEFIARREEQGRAQYEFYIPQSDGGRLPIAVTSRLMRDDDGRAYGIITATDISDQKRVQMELSRANSLLLERGRQMEQELQLAERVQQSLAPKGLSWSGVSVEAHYQPAASIGGDYGLVIPSDDRLDVVVCDVSGHGISSALIANRIYSETMTQIERGAELGSMLRHLNHFAVQSLATSNFYFTLAAVRLCKSGGVLQFAGAGHPPVIVIRQGKSPLLLESTSMILGLFENAVSAESGYETDLQTGDRVVIYTDGLTESFNSRREMLGVDGLQEIVTETSTLPLSEMKTQILNRVAAWRYGRTEDDVSLVLLEIS